LLRRMAERDLLGFTVADEPADMPLLRYAEADASPWMEKFQQFLNTLPGMFVKVDGRAGPRTSEAFFKLTGRYLPGDPREAAAPPEK